jgi:hypothetical protein
LASSGGARRGREVEVEEIKVFTGVRVEVEEDRLDDAGIAGAVEELRRLPCPSKRYARI